MGRWTTSPRIAASRSVGLASRSWEIFGHLTRVRSLLQWIGLWGTVTAAILEGLSWTNKIFSAPSVLVMFVLSLGSAVFAAALLIPHVSKVHRATSGLLSLMVIGSTLLISRTDPKPEETHVRPGHSISLVAKDVTGKPQLGEQTYGKARPEPSRLEEAQHWRPSQGSVKPGFSEENVAIARTLAIEISTFLLTRRPPDPPNDPARNDLYRRECEQFRGETALQFAKSFGGRLLEFNQRLRTFGLADAQLTQDIFFVHEFDSVKDIPTRLEFVARHLSSPEELEVLKLPLKRRLTPNQRKALHRWLTGKSASIEIGFVEGDDEAPRYASDFADLFRQVGWKLRAVHAIHPRNPNDPTGFGIGSTIERTAGMGLAIVLGTSSVSVDALLSGLKEIGIEPPIYGKDMLPQEVRADIYLVVGNAPRVY